MQENDLSHTGGHAGDHQAQSEDYRTRASDLSEPGLRHLACVPKAGVGLKRVLSIMRLVYIAFVIGLFLLSILLAVLGTVAVYNTGGR